MTDLAAAVLTEKEAANLLESGQVAVDKVLSRHLFDGRLVVRRNGALILSLAPPLDDFSARRMELALRDADGVVRARALKAWVRAGLSARIAMKACVTGLADVKEEVQEIAVEGALTLLDRHKGDGADQLIASTADSRPYVRFAAVDILRRSGTTVLNPLLAGLNHREGVARRYVRQLLRQLGAPAAKALVALLQDEARQEDAAQVLQDLDEFSVALTPALKALRREGPLVRACAENVLKAWAKAEEKKLNQPAQIPLNAYYERSLTEDEATKAAAGFSALQLLFNLRDGRPIVRANTLQLLRLVDIGSSVKARVFAAVNPLLKDGEANVRAEAIATYGMLGGPLAPLVEAGEDKVDEVREEALDVLAEAGQQRMKELLDTLTQGQSRRYHVIIDALLRSGPEVIPPLGEHMRRGESPMVREVCARVLGSTGDPNKDTVRALLAALNDEHEAVRFRAIWALDKLEATDTNVLKMLMGLEFSEPVRHVKRAAHKAVKRLVQLAEEKKRAKEPKPAPELAQQDLPQETAVKEVSKLVPAQVVRMLNDGRETVRENVAKGTEVEDIASDAGQALLRGLKDASMRVRQASALSIARNRLDPELAIPALLDALVGAEPPVDGVIVEAVAMYGEAAHGPLIATLEERSYRVARTTGKVAPSFGEELAKRLGTCLKHDRTTGVRRNAADVLGMMGGSAGDIGIQDLLAALQDPTPSLKLQVIGALAAVAPATDEVRQALRETLTFERRASIHRAVDRALKVIDARA